MPASIESTQEQMKAWQEHICQQIRPHLPEFSKPQECLDFLCGDGSIALELFEELPNGSRLIGMDENREALSRFHGKLHQQKNDIYLRKQALQNHPFGSSVFDLAWGVWAFHHPSNLTRILRTLYPTLKPEATFIGLIPLHGSFSEVYRFIQESQDPQEESFVFATREEFPSMTACEKSVVDAGLSWRGSERQTFQFSTNLTKLRESFLMKSLMGLWAGTSATLAKMLEESVETRQDEILQVSVNLGVFCAVKT